MPDAAPAATPPLRCPDCGAVLVKDFDEDCGRYWRCDGCDFRASANAAPAASPRQPTAPTTEAISACEHYLWDVIRSPRDIAARNAFHAGWDAAVAGCRAAGAATPPATLTEELLRALRLVAGYFNSMGVAPMDYTFAAVRSAIASAESAEQGAGAIDPAPHGTLPESTGSPAPSVFAGAATPTLIAAAFQSRVRPWLLECFGERISNDRQERNHRFLEEALELVQACGATCDEAHQLVDYVYGRDTGRKEQEAGGVMVTLAALCLANGIDMHVAGETELSRIWTKIDAIRIKQANKPRNSPLAAATAGVAAAPSPATTSAKEKP